MKIKQELKELIKKNIEDQGFFLYHIDIERNNDQKHLIVYVNKLNHKEYMSLDDCVLITNQIGDIVDQYIAEEYVLEVSSPGINRRLYTKEHYAEVIGDKIKVLLKKRQENINNKKIEGILKSINEEYILIDEMKIETNNIKKAFYVGGTND